MNKFLRIFSVVLAVCTVLSFMVCFAEEEVDWDVREEKAGFEWLVNTPEEYIFTEEGSPRKFILLDITDNPESRFYIMADEYYIDRPFDSTGKSTFDPNDGRNLGGWLNSTFLRYGNVVNSGETMIIPKGMRDHINQNHFWTTDDEPAPTPELGTYGIGLLSIEEAYKYHDKFGVDSGLRTSVLYTNTYGWWMRSQPDKSTRGKLCWRFDPEKGSHIHAWAGTSDGIAVRPCFYLSEDYFREVRINTADMGSAVGAMFKEVYLKDELLGVYSKEELQDILGYKADVNIEVAGWTDQNGNPIARIADADYVTAKVNAKSRLAGQTDAVLMMVLYGEDGCPINFALDRVSIESGVPQTYKIGMKISENQKEHGAYIKIYFLQSGVNMNTISNAIRTNIY